MGKGARSLLLLSCASDERGEAPRSAVYAAAAMELFHLATLVHDDVIDDAETRRGERSLQSKCGKRRAVVVGDYLLCLSLGVLGKICEEAEEKEKERIPFLKYIPSLAGVCVGEHSQLMSLGNLSLPLGEYLRIISGKTAELFRVAALSGAALGGASEREARKAGWFGFDLGVVFQIIDDCKDYEQTEETARKPVNRDLPQGVVTMPLIMALRRRPELAKQAAAVMRGEKDSREAARLVREAGGVEEARAMAFRFAKKAERILLSLEASHQRRPLGDMLEKALGAADKFS
jgi:heptaprenyl diphosphate synthase